MESKQPTHIILDNFLDAYSFVELEKVMVSNYPFPWCWGRVLDNPISDVTDEKYNFQFTHMFYDKGRPMSDHFDLLGPIVNNPKLGIAALIRIKANCNTRTEEIIDHGMHNDMPFECMTGIYYVNSNNGYTQLETGERIQSVENRLCLFNSRMKHSGTTCTDEPRRIVINFNYFSADVIRKESLYF